MMQVAAAIRKPGLRMAALKSSAGVQCAMLTKRNCVSCTDWCSAESMSAGNVFR
jgi:hypothetical protein